MPTPFYHLSVAEALLEHSNYLPGISELVYRFRNAFLFGHVAPDVQVISGQTRESTHFYKLPTKRHDSPPWERMLNRYSAKVLLIEQDPEQAVFVTGYLCHLQADWFWVRRIYEPYFGPLSQWKTLKERLYLHNVLRSYLDYKVLESLLSETCIGLSRVTPMEWLPFVGDLHLITWRDYLANQLKPGAPIQTVEVFASRQGISAEKYYQLISTENEMQDQIFAYFPQNLLVDFLHELLSDNISLLNKYLATVGGKFNANQ